MCGIMQPLQQDKQKKLRRAGGWNVVDGGYDFRLVRRRTIQKWRTAVKKVLLNNSRRKNDPAIEKMVLDCATEWATYACPDYQAWPSLTPLEKQQALFAWILRQKKRSAIDVLVAGIAGALYHEFNPQSRHDDYARAVNIGRSVWILLRPVYRTYHHDSGHGTIRIEHLCITKKIRMRSRYAAQRIEQAIKKHAGWFIKKYGHEVVCNVLNLVATVPPKHSSAHT